MITRLVEIYENKLNSFSQNRMNSIKEYYLREVLVNPAHVVLLRPNHEFDNDAKIKLPEGLHSSQKYSTIYIDRGHAGMEIVVVGDVSMVEEKLNGPKKKVLKG